MLCTPFSLSNALRVAKERSEAAGIRTQEALCLYNVVSIQCQLSHDAQVIDIIKLHPTIGVQQALANAFEPKAPQLQQQKQQQQNVQQQNPQQQHQQGQHQLPQHQPYLSQATQLQQRPTHSDVSIVQRALQVSCQAGSTAIFYTRTDQPRHSQLRRRARPLLPMRR